MGKNILNSAFQKIAFPGISVLLLAYILIIAGLWVGCGGDGSDEGPVTISLRVVGEEEVVFDWSEDRCEESDIPDLYARAFRDDSGQVQLIAGSWPNRRNIGPDLNNLTHDCTIILESDFDPDPAAFNDGELIGSTYTEDGKTIYAVLHNEWQGSEHPGQCFAQEWFKCWFNSLTLAVSTDSGASYQHPVMPPEHLVATYPQQYVPDSGPYGMFTPSNIVKGKDGYYYMMAGLYTPFEDPAIMRTCLMRTDDLSDPDAWRFWDGTGFEGKFINPYTEESNNIEEHVCKPIENVILFHSSLTNNTYIDRYVILALMGDGLAYSVSEDLINWEPLSLFYDIAVAYPSLLDPDSETRNFETTGKTAYLYYTRFNPGHDLDRDLVRVPVEFFME